MLVLKKNYHKVYFDYQVIINQFRDFAKESKIEVSEMGLYIICYLHFMLERMRRDGELTPDQKLDLVQGKITWKYTGEVNRHGQATGRGEAEHIEYEENVYKEMI